MKTRGRGRKRLPNKMLSGGGAAATCFDGARAGPQTPLPLNYYLLALPPAPLASSVPFIAFLNNFYQRGGFSLPCPRRLTFTHQSLIEARVLVFSNKAHLKNLDANYFALFMLSPGPCRFKHFRGHLDSSNYLCLGRLLHE